MRYCFVFVCQAGALEPQALLLAASLRRFLRCEHELVAALPQPEAVWGRPAATTLAGLAALGVRTAPIVNPIGPEYPIGNKLACLALPTAADKIVFLDSDMLCLREFRPPPRFAIDFNAKPADLASWGGQADAWAAAYARAGLPPPRRRVKATVSGETMPPYFNAGMLAVRAGSGLGEAWAALARELDADPAVPDKRPWLDQIALPLAVAKLGLETDCLDERYNFPAHLRPLDAQCLPFLCHYHTPRVLRGEPAAHALVLELAGRHPALAAALQARPEWAALLAPYRLARAGRVRWPRAPARQCRLAAAAPAAILTGVPRSGTSFLCALLARLPEVAVVNEPAEIFAPLQSQSPPHGVALYYRETRRRILDGEPVDNKVRDGVLVEDTALADGREPWLPVVTRPDFLLATKNTLAYLARLPQLRRALPRAAIVACVRHPFDTVASWKRSFPHLASADMERQALGHSRDELLGEPARRRLREIAAAEAPALRRALLWRHLAELILDSRPLLTLLRYEALAARPEETLRGLMLSIAPGRPFAPSAPLPASAPRCRRENLDAEDIAALRGVCAQTAAELGYDLD